MNRKLILSAALLMAGCSSTSTQPKEIEAVRDFVVAAELPEVSKIRLSETLSYTYVNDRYVTVPTRRGDYLVELRRDCFELRRSTFTLEMVDVRTSQNLLQARIDTIRGCQIGRIYEITEGQREEIRSLGDAPGDDIYLPDEE